MSDEQLTVEWTLLEPRVQQHRAMERRVFTWLEASDTSLTTQWLAMFKVQPLAVLSFAAINAVTLLPLSWLGFVAFT